MHYIFHMMQFLCAIRWGQFLLEGRIIHLYSNYIILGILVLGYLCRMVVAMDYYYVMGV